MNCGASHTGGVYTRFVVVVFFGYIEAQRLNRVALYFEYIVVVSFTLAINGIWHGGKMPICCFFHYSRFFFLLQLCCFVASRIFFLKTHTHTHLYTHTRFSIQQTECFFSWDCLPVKHFKVIPCGSYSHSKLIFWPYLSQRSPFFCTLKMRIVRTTPSAKLNVCGTIVVIMWFEVEFEVFFFIGKKN